MSVRQNQESRQDTLTAEQVADYLKNNPDFFSGRDELLREITVPHPGVDGAVSLLEYQVMSLREQYTRATAHLQSLIEIARDNDELMQRLHTLTLSMLDTDDLQEILVMLGTSMRHEFNADAVVLHLFSEPLTVENDSLQSGFLGMCYYRDQDAARRDFERSFSFSEPQVGVMSDERMKRLFPDHDIGLASAALVPLGFAMSYSPERPAIGLIAIGSKHDRFNEQMGTVFLKYMGELVSRKLLPHVRPAQDD